MTFIISNISNSSVKVILLGKHMSMKLPPKIPLIKVAIWSSELRSNLRFVWNFQAYELPQPSLSCVQVEMLNKLCFWNA